MTTLLKMLLVGVLAATSALAGCMGDGEEATGDETNTSLDNGSDAGTIDGSTNGTMNESNETATANETIDPYATGG